MTEQAAETGGQGPPIEEHPVVPYELPDLDNHSFFFVDAALPPTLEAILHRHDAWELLCVTRGVGRRTAGDTTQDFATGEVALIPPMMIHRWRFSPGLCDQQGMVHYLMVAFRHSLVEQCMAVFPELRNRLASVTFPFRSMPCILQVTRPAPCAHICRPCAIKTSLSASPPCCFCLRMCSRPRIAAWPEGLCAWKRTCSVCRRSIPTSCATSPTRYALKTSPGKQE